MQIKLPEPGLRVRTSSIEMNLDCADDFKLGSYYFRSRLFLIQIKFFLI